MYECSKNVEKRLMYKTCKDVISSYAQTGNLEIPCASDVCGVA